MITRSKRSYMNDILEESQIIVMADQGIPYPALSKFSGDFDHANQFWEHFSRLCTIKKIPDASLESFFKMHLVGKASTWASNYSAEDFRNLEEIEKQFKGRYVYLNEDIITHRHKFHNSKYDESTTPDVHIDSMVSQGKMLGIADVDIVGAILGSFPECYNFHFDMFPNKTLKDVRRIANRVYKSQNTRVTAVLKKDESTKFREELDELKGMVRKLCMTSENQHLNNQNGPTHRNNIYPFVQYEQHYGYTNPTPPSQYYSWTPQHFQRNQQNSAIGQQPFPRKAPQRQQTSKGRTQCYNCDKYGHLKKDCDFCKSCNRRHKGKIGGCNNN